jgi:hypothetical protein
MASRITNIDELENRLVTDDSFAAEFKADPLGTLKHWRGTPLETDAWIYRIVVVALAAVILTTVVGAIVMLNLGGPQKTLPEGVIALAATSVGALAGLLAPSPGQAGKQ